MAPPQKSEETRPRGQCSDRPASLVSAHRTTSRTHVCIHGRFRRVAETRRRENEISAEKLCAPLPKWRMPLVDAGEDLMDLKNTCDIAYIRDRR